MTQLHHKTVDTVVLEWPKCILVLSLVFFFMHVFYNCIMKSWKQRNIQNDILSTHSLYKYCIWKGNISSYMVHKWKMQLMSTMLAIHKFDGSSCSATSKFGNYTVRTIQLTSSSLFTIHHKKSQRDFWNIQPHCQKSWSIQLHCNSLSNTRNDRITVAMFCLLHHLPRQHLLEVVIPPRLDPTRSPPPPHRLALVKSRWGFLN